MGLFGLLYNAPLVAVCRALFSPMSNVSGEKSSAHTASNGTYHNLSDIGGIWRYNTALCISMSAVVQLCKKKKSVILLQIKG